VEESGDVEGIAMLSVPPLKPTGVFGSELDSPQSNRLVADCYTAFSQQIFDISMAEVEPIVQPYSVTDYIGGKPMTFICIHAPILSISAI
jgi:hypothetical protein